VLAGASALVAFGAPAGATLTPPANATVVGSGSSTTYFMMQDMDKLFNDSPGYQMFVPFPSASKPQILNFGIPGGALAMIQQTGVSGVPDSFPENWANDVSYQEPPLGSSNGILQLEDQGAHGATAMNSGVSIPVANNINYARSSRDLGSGDLKGLNFEAYARDGVPWFHYTATPTIGASPSAAIGTLTQAQLQSIYNGTITNWSGVGGASAPIVVFSGQEGSGTQSTFKTFLGFDPSAAANKVNCVGATCYGPAVIFENEDADINVAAFTSSQAPFVASTNPDWGGSAATDEQIKSDSIFFFSEGKYEEQCGEGDCGGSPLPSGETNATGSVNGIAPNKTTILEGTFPIDRYLYNVYSNGSNSNIPAANNATVNYVSELGFICNPNKTQSFNVVDINTGQTYLSEIQGIIEANGFFPLSGGAASGTVNQTPIDEGSLPHSAQTLTTGFYFWEDLANHAGDGDPMGYCLSTDTDGNANS
jgi:ABC-type phosphate transport system substrate-binding protein